MKKTVIIVCVLLCVLLLAVSAYLFAPKSLEAGLANYSRIIMDPPDDLRLKIYFIWPGTLTRFPWSAEHLMTMEDVNTVVVESEELAKHSALLGKLNASAITPVDNDSYIDARLYYVFERDNGRPILEVIVNGPNEAYFVNGYEVEPTPLIYEIITPFLSDEDRAILGIE